jgi:hypothetical protein
MNRHPPHRSPADLRPVYFFFFALALYVLVAVALAMTLGPTGGGPAGPLQPPAGLGL